MAVRVLIVDDSSFFRRRVEEMLKADARLNVIGSAANGREAITKTRELKPDVITMDVEMPVMDGISAVRRIMSLHPTPVLMFSSLTQEGAEATLNALDAGALDYLPKNFEEISNTRDDVAKVLCARLWSLGVRGLPKQPKPARRGLFRQEAAASPVQAANDASLNTAVQKDYKLVAIGTSTGGPVALQEVLKNIPASFPLPIVLIQHMPGSFTEAFAGRLNDLCKLRVKQAEDGERLQAGTAYLAPGGQQMNIEARGSELRARIRPAQVGENYKPCVDITFRSIAEAAPGASLAIILTGMGSDGTEGARILKQGGATVWAQDEATSVIYGMPMSVTKAGLADRVLGLPEIGREIITTV